MAFPFNSDRFQGNKKLEACAQSDPAHITPGSPPGDHIRLIQEALIDLGFSISDAPGVFGDSTKTAVLAYKGPPRNILQSWQKTPDPIVGIRTIRTLDDDIARLDRRSNRGGGVIIEELGRIRFTPLGTPPVIKQGLDNAGSQDLENAPVNRLVAKTRANFFITANGLFPLTEARCRGKLLEMTGRGGPLSKDMAEFFLKNSQARFTRVFLNSSGLSTRVATDPSFVANHTSLSAGIQAGLQQLADEQRLLPKTIDVNRLAQGPDQPSRLASVATSISFAFQKDPMRAVNGDPLAFAIGDIQGIIVTITSFSGTGDGKYEGRLSYVLLDHYGSNDSDIIDPGQASLWMLQRKMVPGQSRDGCEPYRVSITVDGVAFSGQIR